jgi:hypothetical protein
MLKSATITLMLAVAFIRWWYGAGWKNLAHNVERRGRRTIDSFSVPTLMRTLFAPWKRIVTKPGAGIDAHLRAIGDNAISRLVGFTVRLTVLLSAGVSLVFLMIFGLVQIIIWPLLPPAAIVLIIGGLL